MNAGEWREGECEEPATEERCNDEVLREWERDMAAPNGGVVIDKGHDAPIYTPAARARWRARRERPGTSQ